MLVVGLLNGSSFKRRDDEGLSLRLQYSAEFLNLFEKEAVTKLWNVPKSLRNVSRRFGRVAFDSEAGVSFFSYFSADMDSQNLRSYRIPFKIDCVRGAD